MSLKYLTKLIVYHGSDITPCIKIDKPLVVYIFLTSWNDAHNNVAYIMIKYLPFRTIEIPKQFECHMIIRFNIGAPALLNLITSLGKRDKMLNQHSILSLFLARLIYSKTCVKWQL